MADKPELLHVPNRGDSSIVVSEARANLIVRGREAAANLTARRLGPETLAEVQDKGGSIPDDRGDAEAQFNIGKRYYFGEGARKDLIQAGIWFRKAAENGHMVAQRLLGTLLFDADGLENWEEAEIWFRKAADHGDSPSQFNLGYMHYIGRYEGYSDLTQAAAWFGKAAEQGLAIAQHYLGVAYLNGLGVRRDSAKGVAYVRKAAEQGLKMSQGFLSEMYRYGRGVGQSDREAAYWAHRADDAMN